MIVDKSNDKIENNPNFVIIPSTTALKIQKVMIETTNWFLNDINHRKIKNPLEIFNENELTQIYVGKLNQFLSNSNLPFCAAREYIDIYTEDANTNRTVDFCFHPNELSEEPKSIYSVEAKRLPAPSKNREKEYVIGKKKNGGIERFKLEEHGKGLIECGMVGYIEKDSFDYWFKSINSWISELSGRNNWAESEQLQNLEKDNSYAKSYSVVHRINDHLSLFHLWIKNIRINH